SRAQQCQARDGPARAPSSLLRRAARGSGPRCSRARRHVGRRALEAEAAGRAGTDAPWAEARAPAKEEAVVTSLPHHLDRTIVVEAPQPAVFRYFTDSERWAAWWGQGSTIDARPGGRVFIRYANGVEAAGEVVEVDAPSRI